MELLVEFTAKGKPPLYVINRVAELLEMLNKRGDIENYTVALILEYDADTLKLEILDAQGYNHEEQKQT